MGDVDQNGTTTLGPRSFDLRYRRRLSLSLLQHTWPFLLARVGIVDWDKDAILLQTHTVSTTAARMIDGDDASDLAPPTMD